MPEPSNQSAQAKPSGRFLWLTVLIPLVLIAAVAIGYTVLNGSPAEPADGANASPEPLALGEDYYVLVRTIELYPTRPDGKSWDRLGDSGPDIRYTFTWQGNIVFESKIKADTLIGSWDALALDLKSAILSGQIDLGGAIDAALIYVESGTEIELGVIDNDLAGKDEAGRVILNLDQLTLGDNEMRFDASADNAIKRVVIRVIDKSLPISQLVEEATRP